MILCCGEALIDMIPAAQPSGPSAFVPHAGGAIYNTSIALGRLGARVGMISGVSTDIFGQMLASGLAENHVTTDLLIRSPRATTLAIVHLVDGSATYAFYDEGSAGRMITEADIPAIPGDATTLYFGGISLVAEPAADTYAALLRRAGAQHLVMLDPNIRPGFITDEARYRARLDQMISDSDVVKVSDEDLAWITQDQDAARGAQAVLGQGPRVVIVTMGAQGATAYSADGALSVPAIKAEVADTVGAGDTFNAGFLAELQRMGSASKQGFADLALEDLRPALERAAQVAAITVSRSGANPPWLHELDK